MQMHSFPRLLMILAATASVQAVAQSQPFDFSYRVSGSTELRPSLVFNDGTDTFVQPSTTESPRVVGAESTRQGPYIVISGLPERFSLVGKGNQRVNIERQVAVEASVEVNSQHVRSAEGMKDSPAKVEAKPVQAESVRQEPVLTSPVPSESTAEAKQASCIATTEQISESLTIEFPGRQVVLSAIGKRILTEHVAGKKVTAVNIQMSDMNDSLSRLRTVAIAEAIVAAGVDKEAIRRPTETSIPGIYFIEITSEIKTPCINESNTVSLRNGHLTVLANNTDAGQLLQSIAKELSLEYLKEGKGEPGPVSVSFVSLEPKDGLARIGEKLDGKGLIILRDRTLVLRSNELKGTNRQ